MPWSWHTQPLRWEQCGHCRKSLRFHAAAGVVKWDDGKLYAIGCLLDKLA